MPGMISGVGGSGPLSKKTSAPAAPAIPTFSQVFGGSGGTQQGGSDWWTYRGPQNPYEEQMLKKNPHLRAAQPKPAGGGTGGPGPVVTNTTQVSPYLKRHLDRYEQRFDVDNTERAIGRATTGAMDAAALGARDIGAASMARRGIGGTGVGSSFLAKRFYEPAQRAAAGSAADIAMQREKDLDALVLGGTGLVRAPDDISLANRDLNLRQSLGYEDLGLRKSAAEQARIDSQMAQYMAMLNMAMA